MPEARARGVRGGGGAVWAAVRAEVARGVVRLASHDKISTRLLLVVRVEFYFECRVRFTRACVELERENTPVKDEQSGLTYYWNQQTNGQRVSTHEIGKLCPDAV